MPPVSTGLPRWVDGSFRFLNEVRRPSSDDPWTPRDVPRLWAYQLHYFGWIWEAPVGEATALVSSWIDRHRAHSLPGWEPYPLSIRIREWIEWLLAHPGLDERLVDRAVASLSHQARALEAQVETHLLGNHLLENAITLCWAGLSLRGPLANRWLALGLRLLERELAVQVLPDGAHDERSPMYQALLAEALLRLAGVAASASAVSSTPSGLRVAELAGSAGRRLAGALEPLTHPDGDPALVNDCAMGQAPRFLELCHRFDLAAASSPPCWSLWDLPSAGYGGVRGGEVYLVFDAGPLGPDHQPGHGHADCLSFELSWRGQRVVTDTGVFTYEPGHVRSRDRGTAAHSTVEIDGRDQAELWAAFRCGSRPRVVDRSVSAPPSDSNGDVRLAGEYRGPGRSWRWVRHRREIRVVSPGSAAPHLAFVDRVTAPGDHTATLRVHLAPGLSVRAEGPALAVLDGERAVARVSSDGFGIVESRSPYHPAFGVEHERVCLEARLSFRDRLEAWWSLSLLGS